MLLPQPIPLKTQHWKNPAQENQALEAHHSVLLHSVPAGTL
jgi:hypothetical protein